MMNRLKQIITATILIFIFFQNVSAETTTNSVHNIFMEEDCYNGIDDEGDGLIDLADPDCFCAEVFLPEPTNLISNPSFTNTEQDCAPDYSGCYSKFSVQDNCVENWLSVNNSIILTQYETLCNIQNSPGNWPSASDYFSNDQALVSITSTISSSDSGSDYIGGTLNEPLIAGENYKFKVYLNSLMFSADGSGIDPTTIEHTINYSLYGHISENNFPYTQGFRICPVGIYPNDYIELGSFEIISKGDRVWVEASLEFEAPQNIERFVFGASCNQNQVSGLDFYTFSTLMDSFKLQKLLPVIDPNPLTVNILDTSNPCNNKITLETESVAGAFYQWYYNNEEIVGATNSIFSFENEVVNSGSYFVQVVDSIGDCGLSDSLAISILAPLEFVEEITEIDCYGNNNGAISLNILNPSGLSFSWTDEQGNFISNNQDLENVTFGSYLLEITDNNNCVSNYAYEITQPDEILLTANVQNIACDEEPLGQISVNAIGGASNFSYSVDGLNFSSEPNFELPPGNYEITVLDENLCQQTLTNVVIEAPDEFLLEVIPSSGIIELGETVQLQLVSNRPLDDAMIVWTPQDVLDCDNCVEVESNIFETTTFQVKATEDGCTVESSILIQVKKSRNVFVPNAFSPNGDGYNDQFEIFAGIGVDAVLSFKVFDRWGALVFDDVTQGWNGDFQNKPMLNGIYVWMAEIQFIDGYKELYRGDVTLMR